MVIVIGNSKRNIIKDFRFQNNKFACCVYRSMFFFFANVYAVKINPTYSTLVAKSYFENHYLCQCTLYINHLNSQLLTRGCLSLALSIYFFFSENYLWPDSFFQFFFFFKYTFVRILQETYYYMIMCRNIFF